MMRSVTNLLYTSSSAAHLSAQAFLALAFGVEGFLMASHKKHEALDQSVHAHLAGIMIACAAFAAAELAAPRSLLLTSQRILACLMQGMWLIEVLSSSPFASHVSCRILISTHWYCVLCKSRLFICSPTL